MISKNNLSTTYKIMSIKKTTYKICKNDIFMYV